MRNLTLLSFITLGANLTLAAPSAYTTNFNTSLFLVDIPSNTEAAASSTFFQTDSLALDPGGNLYSADQNGVIWNVTTPGNFPVGPTALGQIGDLDYASGGLYGFSNTTQTLFFFDLTLNTVTSSVVDPALAALTINGVAHRPSDNSIFLSGYDGTNDHLLQFAPSATTATYIGMLAHGDSFSYISDIDFDASGTLYAMTWFHRWFYTVDPTTAATTFVSTGPHRDVTAMALNPVPEPATLALLIPALFALRKKRPTRQT